MYTLFHIIGLCPDNLSHVNLLDFFSVNCYPYNVWYFQKNYLSLAKLKIKKIWDQLVTIIWILQIGLRK